MGFILSWISVTGATKYHIQVDNNNDFSSVEKSITHLRAFGPDTVTGLTSNTVYYVRLRAENNDVAQTSKYSPVSQTMTTLNPPNSITITAATSTGFTLNWRAVLGATKYDIQVGDNQDFSSLAKALADQTGTSLAITGLDVTKKYYVRIRAKNAIATQTSSYSAVSTAYTKLPTPILTAATSIAQTSFRANWNSVTGAAGYSVQISKKSDFSELVEDTYVTTTTYQFNGLTANTVYYVRVQAQNVNNLQSSQYSANQTVSTTALVATPVLSTPSTSFIGAKVFSIIYTEISGISYFVDVSTRSDFSSFVTGNQNRQIGNISGGNPARSIIDGLNPNTLYYFRLRAQDGDGNVSANTAVQTVKTTVDPTLSSTAFNDGATSIDKKHYTNHASSACNGDSDAKNEYIPLAWTNIPAQARTIQIIMKDAFKSPTSGRDTVFYHWGITDISATTSSLSSANGGGTLLSNGFGRTAYDGPCPPVGSGTHTYTIILYAFDQNVSAGDISDIQSFASSDHLMGLDSISFSLTIAAPNRNPGRPSLIAPHPSQTDVPLDQKLTWRKVSDPDGDPVTYDVYLDNWLSADKGPATTLVSADQTDTTYAPTGGFSAGSGYTWHVEAKDDKRGKIGSPALDFSTVPPPFTVTSTAFNDGDAKSSVDFNAYFANFPGQCTGSNNTIPIAWSNAPAGTQSFVIFMEDDFGGGFVHWYEYDIGSSVSSAPAASNGAVGTLARNEFPNRSGYDGPCPPDFDPDVVHTYTITVFALNKDNINSDGLVGTFGGFRNTYITGTGFDRRSQILAKASISFTVTR